ncbi:MAG: type II secretion system protein [Candidatus Omnitrophota bacterium]|jgi:type II secretory pathway pseudopilin PulG|nr:type II secretion system protein [Candidatus Omnitrophota bacterium]
MSKNKGFTLVELLSVVVIIITLALITIPNYNKARNRALNKEVVFNLKLIAAAERLYRIEQTAYYPFLSGTESGATLLNSNLKLKLNERNWSYSVDRGVTTANVTTAKGTRGGCVYTISSSDNFTGDPLKGAGCI